MVDPLGHQTIPPSPAEPKGQRDFALHPATSARTRCIHRASAVTTSMFSQSVSIRAGGHGGPPLRGGFVRWYVTANLETGFSSHLASALLTSINGKIVPMPREGVAALPYTEFPINDNSGITAYRTNKPASPDAPPRRGCSVSWYAKRRYSHPSGTSYPSS